MVGVRASRSLSVRGDGAMIDLRRREILKNFPYNWYIFGAGAI